MVVERVVLLRIEHLEQRRGRVATEVGTHLVDLVEQEQRVRALGLAHRLDDLAGHRADIGAPVAADLRLVAHAAQRQPHELAVGGARDALSQRRLAHARRTHQAEDGTLHVVLELADGEVLEDALLHLVQRVVIAVELVAGVLDVEVVVRPLRPGQIRDPLQPRPRHRLLRRLLGQLLQPRQLLVDLSAHVFRQLQRGDLLAQLVAVGAGAFAQLVLDGLQLLAQDVLALRLGDLLLHGAFDVVRGLQHLAPAGEQGDHQSQALDRVDRIQHLLLVGGVGGHVVGKQIRESSRIFDGVERLSYLRRDRRQQGEDVAGNPARLECERLHFSALGRRNKNFLHPNRGKRLAFHELQHADAAKWLDGVMVGAGEQALLYRDGVLIDRLVEGLHVYWRGTGKVTWKAVDLREQVADVAGQEIISADKVTLRVNLLVTWQVTDPLRAVSSVADYAQALYREAQLALRAAVGTRTLDALLADKESVGGDVRAALSGRAATFGVVVRGVGLRDIVLPGDMKTLLNSVIAATKEAEANLIRRREETAAARSQANTAKLLAENPVLARLKEMEMLKEVLAGTKATFVFGQGDMGDQIRGLVSSQSEK